MIRYTIIGVLILLVCFFSYLQIDALKISDTEEQEASKEMQTVEKSPIQMSHNRTQCKVTDNSSGIPVVAESGENTYDKMKIPEKDPSSPYYLQEREYQKVERSKIFEGEAKEKLFEIRRKMIDTGFDAKQMSEELAQKLKNAPNGKLSREEFLSLLPDEIAIDFEEMMHLQE